MAGLRPIRNADLPVGLWKNGAGRKADIAEGPGWTVGYAWLDQDAPFSDYAGHDRTITLVEGPGFALLGTDGAAAVRVDAPFTPTAFDGGAVLHCRIAGGPCRVMNVMTARARTGHTVAILDAANRLVPAPAPGETRLLVVLSGGFTLASASETVVLETFDAAALTQEVHLAGTPDARASLIAFR